MKKFLNKWILPLEVSKVKWSEPDNRDYKVGSIFGFGEYKKKHSRLIIEPMSIKNQLPYNTCVFNATASQKEDQEKEVLSVKSLVTYANNNGYISEDGFSTPRNGQKVLVEFGAMKESSLPDVKGNSFKEYVSSKLNFGEASLRKSKTFWSVNKEDEVLELLDKGETVTTVLVWYSGYNQGGGFSNPWLIKGPSGRYNGLHEVKIIGYDDNYHGEKVYILLNSFGKYWGDNGKFYIKREYLHKQDKWEMWANLDIENPIANFINKYDGKNVKALGDPAVYFIQKGKKKVYPNEVSYFAYNKSWEGIEVVKKDILDKIPNGDVMDIEKSFIWKEMKEFKNKHDLYKILDIHLKNNIK